MRSLFKGLAYATLGLLALIPVGAILIAVGIPLLAIGAVIAAIMGAVAIVAALPVIILGVAVAVLFGAVFAIFAAIVGVGILAAKLALLVVAAFIVLRFVGRAMFGGKKKPAPPAISEPVRDPYEAAAERELDQELGIR